MIFLMTDFDSPNTKEHIAAYASTSDEEIAALRESLVPLETLESFTHLDGGGLNVTVPVAIDSDGRRYEDVVFTANTKFTLDGYVYFANGVFAVSLRKYIEDVTAAAKNER